MDQLEQIGDQGIVLNTSKKNVPLKTVDNFLLVMRHDAHYSGIRFNEMSGRAEVHSVVGGEVIINPWTDTNEAASRAYIEGK